MGKILRTVYSAVRLDCGHIIQSAPRPHGTEVHCQVCADTEKRVKAARLGELKNVRELIMELDEGPFMAVAELIAELEAE